jgi:hypothetical protein
MKKVLVLLAATSAIVAASPASAGCVVSLLTGKMCVNDPPAKVAPAPAPANPMAGHDHFFQSLGARPAPPAAAPRPAPQTGEEAEEAEARKQAEAAALAERAKYKYGNATVDAIFARKEKTWEEYKRKEAEEEAAKKVPQWERRGGPTIYRPFDPNEDPLAAHPARDTAIDSELDRRANSARDALFEHTPSRPPISGPPVGGGD